MPLVAWMVAAYLAGSLVGLTRGATGAAVTVVCVGVAAMWVARPRSAAACVLLAAGALSASAWSKRERACASLAAHSSALELDLIDEAAPGGFAHATMSCGAPVMVFIARGRAEAGAKVRARGMTAV